MSTPASRALAKVKGWEWSKGMRVSEGWGLGDECQRIDCTGARIDDIIGRRPFSDQFMQSVRDPVPDMTHQPTIDLAVERLRELWSHPGVRLVESGNGWALITRNGQLWAPTPEEAILSGFETIPWNDRDGGRWAR